MTSRTIIFLLCFCAPIFGADTPQELTLSLSASLQRAQQNNETLLIAQQDLLTAQQQAVEARADGLPQLDAGLSYTRNWFLPSFIIGDQTVTIGAHNNLTGTLGLRQPLYSGGKVFAAIKVAQLYRTYSQENIRLIQQRVHKEVETAYYNVLLAQDLLHVNKLSLARARANLERVERLFQSGRVSEYDLLRAQTQVAELKPDSIRANNHLKIVSLHFKNQIGIGPETTISLTDNFRLESTAAEKQEETQLELGFSSRPDLRQQELVTDMRHKAETVAKSNGRPKLDLVVNGQWEAQKDNLKFSRNDFRQSWFSGISLNVPLFDGFRTKSQVAQARAETRRAELTQKQLSRNAQLEISQAHQQFEEALAQKKAQEQTLQFAQKGLKIAETRYSNGIGTQLEVIDGQLTLQRAQAGLAQAKHDVAVAIVNLEHSLGILGEDPSSDH